MTPEEYLNARAEESLRPIRFQNAMLHYLFYVPPEKSYLWNMENKNKKLKRMIKKLKRIYNHSTTCRKCELKNDVENKLLCSISMLEEVCKDLSKSDE